MNFKLFSKTFLHWLNLLKSNFFPHHHLPPLPTTHYPPSLFETTCSAILDSAVRWGRSDPWMPGELSKQNPAQFQNSSWLNEKQCFSWISPSPATSEERHGHEFSYCPASCGHMDPALSQMRGHCLLIHLHLGFPGSTSGKHLSCQLKFYLSKAIFSKSSSISSKCLDMVWNVVYFVHTAADCMF